jgi:hypothetical protein
MDPKLSDVEMNPLVQQGLQQQFLDYEKKDMRVHNISKKGAQQQTFLNLRIVRRSAIQECPMEIL